MEFGSRLLRLLLSTYTHLMTLRPRFRETLDLERPLGPLAVE